MTVEGILYRYAHRHATRAFRAGAGFCAIGFSLAHLAVGLGSTSNAAIAGIGGMVGLALLLSTTEPLRIGLDDIADLEEACDMTPSLLGRLQAACGRGGELTYADCVQALREAEPNRVPLRLPRKRVRRLMHVPGRSW